MPEQIVRILYCDKPGCENEGRRYGIDDGRVTRDTILCTDHEGTVSVREAFRLGADRPGRPGSRGLSDERLESLIQEE